MNRRTFLQMAALFGAIAAAGPIGCAAARIVSEPKVEELEVKLTRFQDYHPVSQQEHIKINDPLLELHIAKGFSLTMLSYMPFLYKIENEQNTISINDYNGFKESIIKTAEDLGVSEDKLKELSIHDAVMLSGKIVAHRMQYYYGMLNQNDELTELKKIDPFAAFRLMLISDTRNEEARRIDNKSPDHIFSEGKGVCRNYTVVNAAVFQVLKEINQRLKNTYITEADTTIEQQMVLLHAWNMVSTLSRTHNGIQLEISYVDPTWLDTRRRTADATGNEVQVEDEEIYNALDQAHFFSDKTIFAEEHTARLYEVLGERTRTKRYPMIDRIKKFSITNNQADYYTSKAVEKRIEICNLALDEIQDSPNTASLLLKSSFAKAVENMTINPLITFVEYGTIESPKDVLYLKQLEEVQQKVQKTGLFDINKKNIFYGIKFLDRFEEKRISMRNLTAKVREVYTK